MKKTLFVFAFLSCLVYGAVDECKNDVYFANGIATSEDDAKLSLEDIKNNFKFFSPRAYNKVANWKVNYNHTHGIAIDLYESFLQKIYEDKPGTSLAPFIWNLDEIADYFSWSFRGVVRKITEKAPKAKIKEYAAGLAKKLARKTVQVYNKYGKKFTEEQIEAMFNDAFDYLIEKGTESYLDKTEEEIIEEERQDVATHLANFIRSVSQGYGVIVVAHSQGNLFTNRAYNELSLGNSIHGLQWMQQYISMIGVATPANNVLGKDSPYLTFDNDMIQLVPDSLSPNVTNPKRY